MVYENILNDFFQSVGLSFANLSCTVTSCDFDISHALLVQNHIRWHGFQNACYTGDVGDLHLSYSKTHICMICDIFNTKVNTSLAFCSTQIYWIQGRKGLTIYSFYIQVDHFSPCDRSGWHQHPWNLSSAHVLLITKQNDWELVSHSCVNLIFWRFFICITGKGARKVPLHRFEMRPVFSSTR